MSADPREITRLIDLSAVTVGALRTHAGTIARIADAVADALRNGAALFLCGNGGSASQCQHVAAEFTGRFQLERPALRALALTTDTSALTAISNDYSFDLVFARQLEALARPGDVLLGLSTSGSSRNVIKALEKARQLGLTTVALVGPKGGPVADCADLSLPAPGSTTANVQEAHLVALHIICGLVERQLAP